MEQKRTIKAGDIVNDIRSGTLSEAQLLAKYDLDPEELARMYLELLDIGAITRVEAYGKLPQEDPDTSAEFSVENLRKSPRYAIAYPVAIHDRQQLGVSGLLKDVSSGGVGVEGIEVTPGQTCCLFILGDELAAVQYGRIDFSAICRWIKESDGEIVSAGLEITDISEADRQELDKLIMSATFARYSK